MSPTIKRMKQTHCFLLIIRWTRFNNRTYQNFQKSATYLEAFLESSGKSAADYRNQMKPKEARSKVIDGILASRTDCKECKPVYEKYQKIFFKKTKEKFKQEHPEVARYEKATAYLAKHPDDKDSTQKELQEEQEKLLSEIAELKVPLTEVQEDLKKLRDITSCYPPIGHLHRSCWQIPPLSPRRYSLWSPSPDSAGLPLYCRSPVK